MNMRERKRQIEIDKTMRERWEGEYCTGFVKGGITSNFIFQVLPVQH